MPLIVSIAWFNRPVARSSQAATSSAPRRARREGLVVGRTRQNLVHDAELATDRAGEGVIVLDIVVARFRCGLAAREIVERPVELIQRPGPGIALVAHEGLGNGERMATAVRRDACHLAQQAPARWRSRGW